MVKRRPANSEPCEHWPLIRQQLLEGAYQTAPVRRVEIPKPDGVVRLFGISSVVDRFIQQALLQVLTPIFEAHFVNDN